MKAWLCPILAICLFLLSAPPSARADRGHKVVNNGDKPLMAMQLTSAKGDVKTAKIYIPPKGEMVFGDDGWPLSGAGYIEAEEGRTYYVPFMWKGKDGQTEFGGLHVQRIEWDKLGQLVSVTGLGREFEAKSNLQISSDVTKPKIADGLLFLKFKERGDTEYRFKTLFGKEVPFSVEPEGL